ncbi:MAG: sugar phosphate isomerase/epimerase [Gemmatimonadota bacterium]
MKTGLIGIIDEALRQDFFGSLARVAGIGYQGMEFGLATLRQAPTPLPEVERRMADLGLETVNLHVMARDLETDFGAVVEVAHQTGCPYLTIAWGPAESAEQLQRDAAAYDRLGARCRGEGLALCYHNHDHELRVFDGRHGLDILLAHSDPAHLQSQLDVCWVRFGGADPAAFLRRHAGRVPLVHLKDVARLEPGCQTGHGSHETMVFTEVGTGIVDFPAVVAAAREVGAEWGTVEQDRLRHLSPWESITCSFLNLKARGLA